MSKIYAQPKLFYMRLPDAKVQNEEGYAFIAIMHHSCNPTPIM